jgi:hypothetical protein
MAIRLANSSDAQAIHDLHTASVTRLCNLYDEDLIAAWIQGRTPGGYRGIARQEVYVYEDEGRISKWLPKYVATRDALIVI